MANLKLWILTPGLSMGDGTERCLAEQLQRWRERFNIRLYAMRASGVDLRGITVRRIPWLPGPHLLRYMWWFAANTLVRSWDARRLGSPDVVHSPGVNCPDADVISVHMIFGKHCKRGECSHSPYPLNSPLALLKAHRLLYRRLIHHLEQGIYSGPPTLWAISGKDATYLEECFGRPPGSVPVLPHGVDTRQFCPEVRHERRESVRLRLGVADRRVILLVGNDVYIKGVDIAVRALSFLPSDVVLAVAGRVDKDRVRSWARERDSEARVLLWPHSPDVVDYYAAADVLVAPSRGDAYHLPVVEALACGLPAVVSANAGVAELIQDGRHALILHNTEDAAKCANLLGRILEDRSFADDLARNGRALAERYSWEANADRAAAFIEREAVTPRVLVLAWSAWGSGGIERATRTLLQALTELYGSDRVGLLSVWGGSPSLRCRTLWAGPEDSGGRVCARMKIGFAAAAILAARRWHRRLVIVACHPHLAPVARWCARTSGAPYIVWCHGLEAWGPQRKSVRGALQAADAVVAPSQFAASAVEQNAGIDDRFLVRQRLAELVMRLSPGTDSCNAPTERSQAAP